MGNKALKLFQNTFISRVTTAWTYQHSWYQPIRPARFPNLV